MPSTQFTCREKILGGYYADPDTQCQMFHVCVKVAGVGVQDFRFLCPNGTAFDQDHQICAEWEDVDCDATTLYYSSDNFDLYRIGSGFESKAVKYGEDEETFALQRAETGDARINREHQSQSINQQRDVYRPHKRPHQNENANDRDIFKGSSSSNFFNNRNNGKENDEDYDDNVNVNQNRDYEQKRKLVRKQQRRPVQQQNNQNQQQSETQTRRPQRPTGFINNFAGSSYIPTSTSKSPTTANEVSSISNFRIRNGQRQRQFNGESSPTPGYTISTPAPFKQSQQPASTKSTTQYNNGQYYSTGKQTSTENYPPQRPTTSLVTFNKQTENYPSNNPQYKSTSAFTNFQSPVHDKKATSAPLKPTTFSPKAKPFSVPNTQSTNTFPTTFAPRTNAAYTQIEQQTTNYNKERTQSNFNSQSPASSTQKSTPFTQYTPTVPKITSTTPISRSFRFDQSQYDDGSYDSRYDYDGAKEDEFLKTAHSQNIASSRNEYEKSVRQSTTSTTQRPYESPKTENYPKSTRFDSIKNVQKPAENKPSQPSPKPISKKVKDVSYDYAYYDSIGPEPEYEIDTEIKRAPAN
ncbi:mucin-2 isoform X2 [Cylas formicarius]|nr:mucin-2 isoform X2 [Cylas formicarius]XP_060529367.1 mucin-2 isoform X2 [Cylas formicarius]